MALPRAQQLQRSHSAPGCAQGGKAEASGVDPASIGDVACALVRPGETLRGLKVCLALLAAAVLVSIASCGDGTLDILEPATDGAPSAAATGGSQPVEGNDGNAPSSSPATGGAYGTGGSEASVIQGGAGAGLDDDGDSSGGSGVDSTGGGTGIHGSYDECPDVPPRQGDRCNVDPTEPCAYNRSTQFYCTEGVWFCFHYGTSCPCDYP